MYWRKSVSIHGQRKPFYNALASAHFPVDAIIRKASKIV